MTDLSSAQLQQGVNGAQAGLPISAKPPLLL
jgi:hypothetical protein